MTISALPCSGPWTRDAACTLADYMRLDGIVGSQPSQAELDVRTAAARELCARCPVAEICALEADLFGDEGVRGGSLRYRSGGWYRVLPLIPEAVPSMYEMEEGT